MHVDAPRRETTRQPSRQHCMDMGPAWHVCNAWERSLRGHNRRATHRHGTIRRSPGRNMKFPSLSSPSAPSSASTRSGSSSSGGSGAAAMQVNTDDVESLYAWLRLAVTLTLATIGGAGMWSAVVALPAVQAEFAVARADASLPYTLIMVGFCVGSIGMGRLSDRYGVRVPVILGALALGIGYAAAGFALNLWQYTLAQGLLVGVGSSATFAPLLANTSLWFVRRRGIAVAIFASGNYLAGAIWPPLVQHFIQSDGWRHTSFAMSLFCLVTMLPLAMLLGRPPPSMRAAPVGARRTSVASPASLGLSANALQVLLVIAGVACCVAMSMPQVHL